jgi:hypothetical protein
LAAGPQLWISANSSFAQTAHPSPSAWPFPNSPYYNATPVRTASRPNDWPFASTPASAAPIASPPAATAGTPPPHDVALQEKTWRELSNGEVHPIGQQALDIKPEQWKHGETENFIIHYRRLGDAHEVAREIEFDLWNVAQTLGAKPAQYQRKSHVFIFKDELEWKKFLAQTNDPTWSHSLAHGDELFLNVHEQSGVFDSHSLAHETTHAVVSRIYRGRHWPLWLNEGFAEYMGDASVAARHSQNVHRNQAPLSLAQMTIAELTAVQRYPAEKAQVDRLYETSAKFVRYLFNKYPKELFPQFVDRIIAGDPPPAALVATYGSDFADMALVERKFARFIR